MRFLKRIYRIIRYLPVLWRTNSWDHSCCLEIYKHSLNDLKHCILNGYNANGKQLAHKIDIMMNLITRINNDWETYFEKRWSMLDEEFGPSTRFKFEIDVNGHKCFQVEEKNERRNTPEFKKRLKQYFNEETYLKQQDLKMLGNMIAKWSPQLWD